MNARVYKAGIAATALAAGAGIFGFSATASAASLLPTVTKLSASKGSTAGGTVVTITGTNFDTATAVDFGATAGTSLLVLSPTQIAVKAPAGTGKVDVKVTNPTGASVVTGTADDFNYVAPVTAAVGGNTLFSSLGKTTVVASAATYASEVLFKAAKLTATVDGVLAPVSWGGLTGTNATKVLITAPAGTPSSTPASVKLYSDGVAGTADATNAKYAAVISGLSKTSGKLAGGDTVIVTGKGFTTATAWKFGSVAATCTVVTGKADTSVSCVAPAAAAAGPVSVTFTAAASAPVGVTVGATYSYSDVG